MRPELTEEELDQWFRSGGWTPGRDIGDQVDELTAEVREKSAENGFPLEVTEPVRAFLREFGGLKFPYGREPDAVFFEPIHTGSADEEDITELGEHFGAPAFPVGFMTDEGAVLVMDGAARMFLLHHTGDYWLGQGARAGLARLKQGAPFENSYAVLNEGGTPK
ncbi:hypothetical protein SRB5_65400 [Streptomyces sp. RB5]|uniref:SUKH-3 immunity protein n=1 Tax=Streptomyces smaragdinus TaxID=2585196 RepID=A0A7K0CTL2_9ACTN|nr:SUKH-3 domain-containing protein [Streptomyces smaragdinus]MQY16342.1 hypothetical protein [Streptomyces smaragdinus]